MTDKPRSTAEIRREISNIAPDLRIARSRAIAARLLAAETLDKVRSLLLTSRGGEDVDSVENCKNVASLAGNFLNEARDLEFLATALEGAPITTLARELLDPLYRELAEAEDREAAEQADAHARQAAIEAERRKMIDDVMKQIEVKFGPSPATEATEPTEAVE